MEGPTMMNGNVFDQPMFRRRRRFPWGWLVLAAVLVGGLFTSRGLWRDYSDGERTGEVVKFSRKGFVKSWEGEMALGSSGTAVRTWTFSVRATESNQPLIDQLVEAVGNGKPVVLHYHQWGWKPLWVIDTDYEVDSVKVLP
jgi:hypothetical protein